MRVVLASRAFVTNSHGGMENVCAERAHQLARDGHDVHVLTGGHMSTEEWNGCIVHQVGGVPFPYTDELARGMNEMSRTLMPDILHLESYDSKRPWWTDRPGQPGVIATTYHGGGWGKYLTVWNTGGEQEVDYPDLKYQYNAILGFDRVLGISKWEVALLRACFGRPDARLVYNPIPDYFFEAPTAPPGPDAPILFVTKDASRGYRVAQHAAMAAGKTLYVAQGIPRDEMPEYIDGCQAMVLPTGRCDGFDLTVAEVLARQRPVFASTAGAYGMEDYEGYTSLALCEMADALAKPMPVVPPGAADRHTPRNHIEQWLEAVQ